MKSIIGIVIDDYHRIILSNGKFYLLNNKTKIISKKIIRSSKRKNINLNILVNEYVYELKKYYIKTLYKICNEYDVLILKKFDYFDIYNINQKYFYQKAKTICKTFKKKLLIIKVDFPGKIFCPRCKNGTLYMGNLLNPFFVCSLCNLKINKFYIESYILYKKGQCFT